MIFPTPGGPEEPTKFEQDFQLATGKPCPKPPSHPVGSASPAQGVNALRVDISHEYFTESLVLSWEGQSSEEMSHTEALEWLRKHGAKNEEKMNEAINCAMNFGRAVFTIRDAKKPDYKRNPEDPVI